VSKTGDEREGNSMNFVLSETGHQFYFLDFIDTSLVMRNFWVWRCSRWMKNNGWKAKNHDIS
jgi:hypothetical protein